jgi:hypothetical protein
LGELRQMATAIPGANYLFSIFQHVLIDQPTATRLRLQPLVTHTLRDWQHLAQHLSTHPTHIQSLVPNPPDFLGAVDASGAGLGGFWIPTPYTTPHKPIAFRMPFPCHIRNALVSADNPTGSITNSDLELAALAFGAAILRRIHPMPHATLDCGSDNLAAANWCNKGSTSPTKPRAYILRWLANLTRRHDFTLSATFVPDSTNTLADHCSRSFHLSQQDFQESLQCRFLIKGGWTVV